MNTWQSFLEANQAEIILWGKNILITLLIILSSWLICRVLRRVIVKVSDKVEMIDKSVGKVFYSVVRVFVWLIALLIILDRFGVNTASIITILGAAGLTVGLALKDSLSNIAAGLMLFVLRPYRSGDYVDCGSVSGTIKEMGLFSTELMTVDGLYIMVPNSVIIGSPVKNYSRNPLRRADISVGISYGDSLSEGLAVLNKLLADHPKIEQEPLPEVLVAELADNSVNLTLRFWVTVENYWEVYWEIKSQLKPVIEEAGLNIPFPQRVITLASALPENISKK